MQRSRRGDPMADSPLRAPADAQTVLVVALLIRTIGGLRAFDTIMIITDGGRGELRRLPTSWPTAIGLQYFDMGKASASDGDDGRGFGSYRALHSPDSMGRRA